MGNGYPHSTIAQILEDIISQLYFEGESHSNIADILLSILNQTSYDKEPYSVLAELFLKLKAKIEGEPFDPYDKETHSVIADILISILNETEYTDVPQSRIAELLLELKEELESYTEITVSGSIVSFTTNVSKPLVKLKANVEAQQDLHGYDKPWAGGGGSNKWDEEYVITASMIVSKNYIPCQPNTSYYRATPNNIIVLYYDSDKTQLSTSTWGTGTFTTPNDCYYLRFQVDPAYGTTYHNDIAINYPSNVTTYSPYENICPITGWSGAVVLRTGSRNILDPNATKFGNYTISPDGSHNEAADRLATHYLRCKPNTSYKAISDKKITSYTYAFLDIAFYDENLNYISRSYTNNTNNSFTFTTPANAKFLVYSEQFNGLSNVTPAVFETYDRCLVEGNIDSYEPFVGNTYTIQFGNEYYGGELDVTNGVLRVTHELVDMGTANWEGSYYQFTIPTPSEAKGFNGDNLCSIYPRSAVNNTTPNVQTDKSYIVRSDKIYVKDTDYNGNLAGFKTAMAGQKLVFELATPIEIQLTPTEIETFVGNNIIFADTGDVEVTYLYKGTPET